LYCSGKFPGRTEENHGKISVRTAEILAEIRTKHHPNASIERYHYINLLVLERALRGEQGRKDITGRKLAYMRIHCADKTC
jgi:hypothetical protein